MEFSLNEAIDDLKKDMWNKVIIINKKSSKYQKEFENLNIKKINLSIEISHLVSDLSTRDKKMKGADILKNFLEEQDDDIIALDDISYIFSPELGKIEISSTLKYFTRDGKIVIVFIDGKLSDNKLTYSSVEKLNYIEMDVSQNKYVLGWEDED
ncbi:MAG: BREX-3 system P-loop-containing protein BrxF [Methanobrevibacter sp.]|jgi:hypothetical protein|nr:BREX-3 system P-loop-containing protein BrxF [Candidatus Methanoflexus mossambicus]